MRGVVGLREADHVVSDAPIAARYCDRLATEGLRQPKRVGDTVALFLAKLNGAASLDIERRPRRVQPVGQALGIAHEPCRSRILADADHDALACRPRPLDRPCLHLRAQLLVHALGGAPQSELAQRGQIGRREEMLQRPLGLFRDIDLSFLQALDQVVRRDVDQFHGIGAIEDGVRHRLADAHAGDLRDDVVQALEVLDVDGGVDVDALLQQLLDIEIALRMPATRRVRVRELIDQGDLRSPGNDGVEVHLLQPLALVFDPLSRHGLQALKERLRLLPAMRLHDTDDDIVAVALARASCLQHRIGLADAGCRTDEHPELALAALLLPGNLQQGLRRGPLVVVAPLFRHHGFTLRTSHPNVAHPAVIRAAHWLDPG